MIVTDDLVRLAATAVIANRMRSVLTALGIAVGIGAVVLLTAIGNGVHLYVISQFTQFGTHLIALNPGKTETLGMPGLVSTERPMTLADAEALARLPEVRAAVPAVVGNGRVAWGARGRDTYIYGVNDHMPEVWQMEVAAGRFLPPGDPDAPRALAVLGSKLKAEVFGDALALGDMVNVGGSRFRVIGVMAPKGQILGFDIDDAIYLPARRALALFNRDSLQEIDVLYHAGADEAKVVARLKAELIARHGSEDFTITTQTQMLDVLGRVLGVLTFAVGALGGISLLVGAVGILTIMTIGVTERRGEIGLLRALGATRRAVLTVFLGEAVLLSAAGGFCGIVLGVGGALALGAAVPALPVHIAWRYAALALVVSAVIGLAAGVLPARRAAGLDPVEALRAE
jgi:putative ABC transport system permease protein